MHRMIATLHEGNVGACSVAYGRDDTYIPVYITATLAAVFCAAAWFAGALYWLALALAAGVFTYYNIPLLEDRAANPSAPISMASSSRLSG